MKIFASVFTGGGLGVMVVYAGETGLWLESQETEPWCHAKWKLGMATWNCEKYGRWIVDVSVGIDAWKRLISLLKNQVYLYIYIHICILYIIYIYIYIRETEKIWGHPIRTWRNWAVRKWCMVAIPGVPVKLSIWSGPTWFFTICYRQSPKRYRFKDLHIFHAPSFRLRGCPKEDCGNCLMSLGLRDEAVLTDTRRNFTEGEHPCWLMVCSQSINLPLSLSLCMGDSHHPCRAIHEKGLVIRCLFNLQTPSTM